MEKHYSNVRFSTRMSLEGRDFVSLDLCHTPCFWNNAQHKVCAQEDLLNKRNEKVSQMCKCMKTRKIAQVPQFFVTAYSSRGN